MRVDDLLASVAPDLPCVLVTVALVEGSAPREPGASMLVTAGDVVGTIGGGRLEHAAIARARDLLRRPDAGPLLERHALGPGLGQCCGGAVTLWTAALGRDAASAEWCRALACARERGEAATLVTVVASERDDVPRGTRIAVASDGMHGAVLRPALAAEIAAIVGTPRAAGCVRVGAPGASATILVEPDPREPPVVVFGAGHVGRALVPLLATLTARVVWVDPRADAFPDPRPAGVACRVVPEPEDEVDAAPPGACFVVLTHDHALDLQLAEAVLRRGDFAWLGVIGSATKRARFARRLRARGIPAERVEAMRCPIGLPGVGGKVPAEIAVAVAAELLAERTAAARAATPARAPGRRR